MTATSHRTALRPADPCRSIRINAKGARWTRSRYSWRKAAIGESFEAFTALSPRPDWTDRIAWDETIGERGQDLWSMLGDPKTYVYVAGLEKMRDELDNVLATVAGSPGRWERRKAELVAGKRWVELLY